MEGMTLDRRFCHVGVEVLRVQIRLRIREEGEIGAWYRALADRALTFCREQLLPYAESVYDGLEDGRKRFRFPTFLYRMEAVGEERGGLYAVRLEVTLRRRGEWGDGERFVDGQVWEEGSLLPPREGIRRLCGRELGRAETKGAAGWFFRGSEVFLLRQGREQRLDFSGNEGEKG